VACRYINGFPEDLKPYRPIIGEIKYIHKDSKISIRTVLIHIISEKMKKSIYNRVPKTRCYVIKYSKNIKYLLANFVMQIYFIFYLLNPRSTYNCSWYL